MVHPFHYLGQCGPERSDGWYVVAGVMLIPVADQQAANGVLRDLRAKVQTNATRRLYDATRSPV